MFLYNFKKPILEAKKQVSCKLEEATLLSSRSSFLKSWKPIWEAMFWAKKRLPKLASQKWASWSLRVYMEFQSLKRSLDVGKVDMDLDFVPDTPKSSSYTSKRGWARAMFTRLFDVLLRLGFSLSQERSSSLIEAWASSVSQRRDEVCVCVWWDEMPCSWIVLDNDIYILRWILLMHRNTIMTTVQDLGACCRLVGVCTYP